MENWKRIQGYPLYEVSDLGRIRSWQRNETTPYYFILSRGNHGYPIATLCHKGLKGLFCVHRLVLETFIGPAPNGTECCHADGNKTNNSLDNLRWDTRGANNLDRYQAEISDTMEKRIKDIRKLYATGEWSQPQLAKKFEVSQSTVWRYVHRITRAYIL